MYKWRSGEFNPSCVCGGSLDNPNRDCERCMMHEYIRGVHEAHAATMAEVCEGSEVGPEVHCTCVPFLRAEVERLRGETWYLLYEGSAEKGWSRPEYVGRTTDYEVARAHHEKCQADPCSTGKVVEVTDTFCSDWKD